MPIDDDDRAVAAPAIPHNENLCRPGRFRISYHMISQDWDVLEAVFSGVIVVEAVSKYMGENIHYWAYSNYFEEIPEGEVVPLYVAQIHETVEEDGERSAIEVIWKRAESVFPGAWQ